MRFIAFTNKNETSLRGFELQTIATAYYDVQYWPECDIEYSQNFFNVCMMRVWNAWKNI